MTTVTGVDAAAGEWLAVVLVDGHYEGADLRPAVADILRLHPSIEKVAVDIPIGLPLNTVRPADIEARQFVGSARSASVFFAPPRAVLEARPYEAAVEESRRRVGPGISRQAYSLRDRIFEVASLAETDDRLVEVHPEVSFRALNGAPLRFSKHTWNGVAERRTLLASVGILIPDEMPEGGRVAPDDVVDAAVAAWSALRVLEGRSRTLPTMPSWDRAMGGVIHY
jgi:predicted RNase H-like nuclease